MEINLKEVNSFTQEMTVGLEWNEIAEDFNAFIGKFGKKIKMPGFRPGKIPKPVLIKQFLPVIESQFVDDNIQKYYMEALREKETMPVNKAEIKDVHFHRDEHFKFTAVFEVEVAVELPKLKANSIPVEKVIYQTDEEDIILAIDDMRRSRAEVRTVEDGAKEGNLILADLQKTDESGIPIIGEKLEKRYIKIGDGVFTGDNQKKLIGVKPGGKAQVMIPDGEEQKEAPFEISVINVEEEILPEVNLDFIKQMDPEAKDIERWKEGLKEQIEKGYLQRAAEQFDRNISDALISKISPEFAPSMVESYLDHIVEDVKANNQGAKIEEDKVRETYRPLSERNLKWYSIRKAIIKDQDLKILAEEVKAKIDRLVEESPKQAQEINKFYKKPSNRTRLEDDLMEKKIIDHLLNFVKVKEIKVHTKDLRKKTK
ncbi:MAG: trigger factor [Candidatus Neomarinimicrobiota bacterium]